MILTVPNLISFVRILLIPVFLWLLLGRDDPVAAGWLFGGIAATDWVDGYLARRLGQVSVVGEFLDPVADRGAVVAALIGGLISGDLPAWFAWALVVRESGVAIGGLVLGLAKRTKLTVRWLGKAATFGVYTAVAWFFIGFGGGVGWVEALAWVVGIPALVMYYVVGAQYLGDLRQTMAGHGAAV